MWLVLVEVLFIECIEDGVVDLVCELELEIGEE